MNAESFWDRVDRTAGPSECWPWMLAPKTGGYGEVYIREDGARHSVQAHRMAFALAYGPIADGLFVCHACDNRICCNPQHLILGTNRENVGDMVRRRRHANQRVTHCPNGHEYTEANTKIRRGGKRRCLTCHREGMRKYRERSEAEAVGHGRPADAGQLSSSRGATTHTASLPDSRSHNANCLCKHCTMLPPF